MSERDPFRSVTSAHLRERTNGIGCGVRWWDLHLECGHIEERPVRYSKQTGHVRRGFAAMYHPRDRSDALAAPKRVRCGYCGAEARMAARDKKGARDA